MVGGVRLGQFGELAVVPGESAAVDNRAADTGAMAADELGQGVDDDIGAVLQRLEQVGGGNGIVHHERDAGVMGDLGNGFKVIHIVFRIAHRLHVDQAGIVIDSLTDVLRIGSIDELHLDAEPRQGVVEQVVGPAVEEAGGDDILAGAGDIEHRIGGSRLAGSHRQGADTAVKRCQALFEHVGGRIHQPGIDVAELLEAEEVGGMLRTFENVGRCLVDGNGAGEGLRSRESARHAGQGCQI